jgi:hypothetical protein
VVHRKTLFLFLAALLVLAAGCGNNDEAAEPAGETPVEQPATPADDSGGGATPAETDDGSGAPPEMTTPGGQTMNGLEAFISVGGVNGIPDAGVQNSLVNGYQRAGFRVHYVVSAMSFDPFAVKMAEVAAEYRQAGRTLSYVVFHHTGHGWDDHITYQNAQGTRGSTTHNEVAVALGVLFPKPVPEFKETLFGLVYDACGQGGATNHTVRDRQGVAVTSTPDAAPANQCAANNCSYICEACWTQTVPAYTYSQRYGDNLQPPPDVSLIDEALQAAHNSGQNAILQQGSPSGCQGKFRRY